MNLLNNINILILAAILVFLFFNIIIFINDLRYNFIESTCYKVSAFSNRICITKFDNENITCVSSNNYINCRFP